MKAMIETVTGMTMTREINISETRDLVFVRFIRRMRLPPVRSSQANGPWSIDGRAYR